ncbi:hypothetical protein GPL15_06440 [Clostridium sp. MCC353]|uniref:DUF6147 family protein n=1 Tax=Clostridium sp. MCC353 TaxID=2592646 RepID=UPI001C00B463|nr:DUF6147 family protein [Clostridium sp. MCC353]MBT9776143.1 hypothetical protein [Clostridium sp. MCC353]
MRIKRYQRLLCIVLILSLFISTSAYAEEETKLLPPGQSVSFNLEAGDPRGMLMASRIASITNNEDGTINASGQIIAHATLDYAMITLYLDKYDPDIEDWVNLSYIDTEFTLGEGDCDEAFMGAPSVSYTLTGEGIVPGYYYRLRGTYLAKKEGRRETAGAITDGVLLTKIK